MAGYVAENIIQGDLKVIHWQEIAHLDRSSTMIIDVSNPEEYAAGHLEGAINIPVNDLRRHLADIPRDMKIVLYYQVGLRGYIAFRILTQHGFTQVRSLSGGWLTYSPVMREKALQNAIAR